MNQKSLDAIEASATELYRRYRPKMFKEVLGQREVVESLAKFVKAGELPHAVLLVGPSGTGKTTLARIIADKLQCHPNDVEEIDCAKVEEPLDEIRRIVNSAKSKSLWGDKRVWILNEWQALSRTRFAQQAILTVLESPPPWAYFVITTTDASKIIDAIKTRCTTFRLKALTDADVTSLLKSAAGKEGKVVEPEVLSRIVEVSNGSARQALTLLKQVLSLDGRDKRLNVVVAEASKDVGFAVAQALIDRSMTWEKLCERMRQAEGENPDDVRRMILSYAGTILLKGTGPVKRAARIANEMKFRIDEDGKAGWTALAASLYYLFEDKS